ncbi:hypothetical protein [Immundisolibacter sp.]
MTAAHIDFNETAALLVLVLVLARRSVLSVSGCVAATSTWCCCRWQRPPQRRWT